MADTLLGDVLIQGEDRYQTAGVKRGRGRDIKDGRMGLEEEDKHWPPEGREVGVAKAATSWSSSGPEPSVPSV